MGNHDSVAVAAKSLLQQSSQLAVPIVHIPKHQRMMVDMIMIILCLLLSERIDTVAKSQERSVDGRSLLQTQARVLISIVIIMILCWSCFDWTC